MTEVCKHKRFDGAQCVQNKGHEADSGHGYAYRPAISEQVWEAAHEARAWRDDPTPSPYGLVGMLERYEALLFAVESDMGLTL